MIETLEKIHQCILKNFKRMNQEWEGHDIHTFVSKYLIYKITHYIKACSLKKVYMA